MPQRIGVVLAGGAGRRLGRPKGMLELDGHTFAERAARTLQPICASVLVSIGPGDYNPAPDFAAVEDEGPAGRGPLAGVYAALEATGQANLLVLACDYPRVGAGLLERIAAEEEAGHDLVMVTDRRGRDHPLVALWLRSSAAAVKLALAEKRHKVRALLAELDVLRLTPAELPGLDLERQLLNVNDPDDLARL